MQRHDRSVGPRRGRIAIGSLLLLCGAIGSAFGAWALAHDTRGPTSGARAARANAEPSALELVLAPQAGTHPLDERIRTLQRRIPSSKVPAQEIERLSWTFIARARELDDAGGYQLALAGARAIEAYEPGSHAALLLRGHALHSLHRFVEAEQVARRLVAARGLPHDHGLLGDVLVDRGALDEAIDAYQQMVDERPDMHSYARAAHVRYLKGDLAGALDAMQMAARAASPRNRESFAWTWSKLAHYELQSGRRDLAQRAVAKALEVFPDSPHARKAEALLALAADEHALAVAPLRKAIAVSPHPELLWMLIESLTALGRDAEAGAVRAELLAVGQREDPRAFALYLATQREQLELAEQLVRDELAGRGDIYTYEALAWVQSARGQQALALESARRSLAAGTQDPRLYYHAGLIAERAGDAVAARQWLARAESLAPLLLPSQRAELRERSAAL
jgi:tetratricopeptide (TPR) repeat protein